MVDAGMTNSFGSPNTTNLTNETVLSTVETVRNSVHLSAGDTVADGLAVGVTAQRWIWF